jgi:response regulator RpfG family c-di-GMP phosphodiesterase
MNNKSVLICEPDRPWDLKICEAFDLEDKYEVKSTYNGKDAQKELNNKHYDIVIIDLNLSNFSSIEVIKFIKFNNLKTKIIVTCVDQKLHDEYFSTTKMVSKLGIAHCLIKPYQARQIITLIEKSSQNEAWKEVEGRKGKVIEEEVSELDDSFTSVKIENFYCGNVSIFDLFIRMKRNKFLKILHAGDFMEQGRLDEYQNEKGITHLYFKTKERAKYINYMNNLLSKISSNPNVKTEKKVSFLKTASEKYIEEIYLKGINESIVAEGISLCNSMYTTISNDPDLGALLKKHFEYSESAEEHTFLTTFFATVIANQIPWVTERSIKIITMGAFFHDIGKIKLPASTRSKKHWEMSEEQIEEYKKHCLYGVELLDGNPLVNEQILQIIYQHHELINGEGFPSKLSGTRIYPLAKIISFADFIANYAIKTKLPPFLAIKKIIEERKDIFNYDPECVKAMIRGLIPNEK